MLTAAMCKPVVRAFPLGPALRSFTLTAAARLEESVGRGPTEKDE